MIIIKTREIFRCHRSHTRHRLQMARCCWTSPWSAHQIEDDSAVPLMVCGWEFTLDIVPNRENHRRVSREFEWNEDGSRIESEWDSGRDEEEGRFTTPSSTVNSNTTFCSYCNKPEPPNRCQQCRSVSYCNRECQTKHWKTKPNGHKKQCKKLAAAFKNKKNAK